MADDQIIALTRAWVEKAVIGLNLCPDRADGRLDLGD
jgi:hypothetical protein